MDRESGLEHPVIVQRSDPLNVETKPAALVENFLTPQSRFYIRNHGTTPQRDDDHRIRFHGLLSMPIELSVAELKRRFPPHNVVAVMQCAGNRRADLQKFKPTSGDPWGVGAIGNAEWTGVLLSDVLDVLKPSAMAQHVAFTALDDAEHPGGRLPYGASIPLSKAVKDPVLLAYAMNGEALTPDHGAPLRVVVPGYAGARSVKWVADVEVRETPSDLPIQSKDYKFFPGSVSREEADWSKGVTINALPINSAICEPADGSELTAGVTTLRGYAVAYGRAVARVDVSVDGGRSWLQAELERDESPWSWVLWKCQATLASGTAEVIVRAWDEAGQTQPETVETMWNFAGYLGTMWHRVYITVK
ncbi:sulfite oxidase [Rhodoligotrophos appendicifer]|uniref:molybdopterin-dependent oxidoreductase n=1 Tax=Rhodoligotrophos appendicifer TaxID=987056 RepID=UPI001186DC8B|nr:molybdopterin-dependent oxidoreductase [Rhodoligotrophos appendicifer]